MADKLGSKKADNLKATANDQAIYGGADTTGGSSGNDTLSSGVFTDISLYGGDGNDMLIAKSGQSDPRRCWHRHRAVRRLGEPA